MKYLLVALTVAAATLVFSFASASPKASCRPSTAVLTHIQHDQFQVVRLCKQLPKPVRDYMLRDDAEMLREERIKYPSIANVIADPGKPFSAGCTGAPLPFQRLIFAASNDNYCVVYYEYGGIASGEALMLYQINDGHAVPIALAYPGDLKSFQELQNGIFDDNILWEKA